MWTTLSILLAILIVVSAGMLTPTPIDWTPSYSKADPIPYGCTLLYGCFDEIFPGQTIHTESNTPYEHNFKNSEVYLSISEKFEPDLQSWNTLLGFADDGGTVFISSNDIAPMVLDSLHLKVKSTWTTADSIHIGLTAANLRADSMVVSRGEFYRYFVPDDGCKASVLGYRDHNTVNYLRIAVGGGWVYLHCNPYAFSNYLISEESTRRYAFSALSLLPQRTIVWDEYFKIGHRDQESYYRMVFRDARLRTAYYLILSIVVLFILFHRKRITRAMRVREPLKNTTVDFVQTVGRLYYEHRDSRSIIEKMIVHFQDYLRSTFYLRDVSLSRASAETVAAKAQKPLDEVRSLFANLQTLSAKTHPEDSDVRLVYEYIHEFKSGLQK